VDAVSCPYTPGAGTIPRALAGRQRELEQFRVLLGRLRRGNPEQSLLVSGLRGVGKTVLLEAFQDIAVSERWVARTAEATHDTRLPKLVATLCRSALLELSRTEVLKARVRRSFGVLKSFTVSTGTGVDFTLDFDPELGTADSGDLARDLSELLIEVGEVSATAERGVVFLLDEVQFLERADFEALIAAMHLAARRVRPFAVVGAGLPMLPRLAGDAKSYSERLFRFPRIGALPDPDAREALVAPARELGVEFEDDALTRIFELSGRYPYFLQEYGKHAWLLASESPIRRDDAERAHAVVPSVLDDNFFSVRIERATDAERRYLAAIADLGDGPQRSGEVTRRAGYSTTTETGPIRDSVIKKGLVHSPRHGEIDFTAPHFADFMRRNYPLEQA
jgi:hypothetical protein